MVLTDRQLPEVLERKVARAKNLLDETRRLAQETLDSASDADKQAYALVGSVSNVSGGLLRLIEAIQSYGNAITNPVVVQLLKDWNDAVTLVDDGVEARVKLLVSAFTFLGQHSWGQSGNQPKASLLDRIIALKVALPLLELYLANTLVMSDKTRGRKHIIEYINSTSI